MCRKLYKIYKKCNGRRPLTWVYYFEPQRKIDNKMWLTKKAKRRVKAKKKSTKKSITSNFSFVTKVMYSKLLFQKTDKSLDMYTKSCAEER